MSIEKEKQRFEAIEPDTDKETEKKVIATDKKTQTERGIQEPYFIESEDSCIYLGVEVKKGNGGIMVPGKEAFKDYFYTEEDYVLMREIATSLSLNHPLLVEGGTGIGKTSAVKRMCADLNMNYCLVSFSENTDLMDVIGHRDVVKEEGQETFKWFDGKLIEAIRHGGVAFLDEYNYQGGKIGGRINPIIDAILNGDKKIILPENNNEVIEVSPDFRLIAAQNPPGMEDGEEFPGRDVLSSEKFGRWTYHKLPIGMSRKMEENRLMGMIGEGVKVDIAESEFRRLGGGVPLEELKNIPGMQHWVKKYAELKEAWEKKTKDKSMGKQAQRIYFNPRLGQKILRYVGNFYNGDINETWKNALEYYVVKMFKSETEKEKIRETINISNWIPPKQETKRKGLEREKASGKEIKKEADEETIEKSAKEKAKEILESALKDSKIPKKLKKELEKTKETIFSPEVIEDIEQQYAFQKEIFLKLGILKETGKELIITDIEGKEHVFPTLEQIKQSLEKQEHLKQKTEQGFIKLLIVPIGMKLNDLREIYKQQILKHHKEGKLLATKEKETDKDEPLELKESEPLWTWDEYENADINGKLVYFPEQFDKDNHKGKTKKELIKEQGGFNIVLIEDMPNIPQEGRAKEIKGRKQIDNKGTAIRKYMEKGETVPCPAEYLKAIQSDPQYKHEQGMCPEDQLIYAMLHLEQTNQVIDDYQGKGRASHQVGAYFPDSAYVPDAYWRRDDRRASLGRAYAGGRVDGCGLRPAVKVSI